MSGKQTRRKHRATKMAPDELLAPLRDDVAGKLTRRFGLVKRQLGSVLGEPFFAEDGFVLYNMDCAEALAAMSEAGISYELTVTSPPYNIGKEYEVVKAREEYLRWCSEWMTLVHEGTVSCGAFWLNLGYFRVTGKGKAVPIAYLLWDKSPFYLLQEIVWNYGAGVTTKWSLCPRNEKWLFYVKDPDSYTFNLDDVRDPNVKYPNSKRNGKLRVHPKGKNPSDVWYFPKVTTGRNRSSKERTKHPAQFPLKVIDRIVKVSSNPGDLVLDPFIGSGSTAVAAVGNGRVCVGVEVSEDYCVMAVERYRAYVEARRNHGEQVTLL